MAIVLARRPLWLPRSVGRSPLTGLVGSTVARGTSPLVIPGQAGRLGAAPEVEAAARKAVEDGWQLIWPGDTPTLQELQVVQAIGALESSYGRGWKDKPSPVTGLMTSMEGSHNWGGVHCKCKPVDGQCCDGCGYWFDSRPTESGQKYYEQCFAAYPDDAHGAAGILAILTHMQGVLNALPSGDIDEVAWQMRKANYFQGFKVDPREAAADYAKILDAKIRTMSEALGEPRAARRRGGITAEIPGGDSADRWAPGELPPGAAGGAADEEDIATFVGKAVVVSLAGAGAVAVARYVWQVAQRRGRQLRAAS